jgi:hypothetical protein
MVTNPPVHLPCEPGIRHGVKVCTGGEDSKQVTLGATHLGTDALERERRAPHVEHKVGSDAAIEHRIQAVHLWLVSVIEQQRRQVLLRRRSHAPAERAVQQGVKALCTRVELLSAGETLTTDWCLLQYASKTVYVCS